jgi:hypothetical protein
MPGKQLLLFGLLLAVLGCTKTKSEVRAAPSGIGLETKVLEAGAEPREQLRYKRVTGLTEDLVIDVSLASFLELGEDKAPVESPILALGLTLGSTTCAADGVCTYPIAFRIIAVKMPEGANDADAEAATKSIAALAQVTGTYEVDARGLTRRAELNIPTTVSTRLATLLGNIRTALISVPLPEEAVGIGARWQVQRLHEVANIKTTQTVVYTLVERQDRILHLGMTLEQTAAPQQVPFDSETAFNVEAYEVKGTANMLMSLDAITPLSELHANSELRGIVQRGGKDGEVLRLAGSGDVIVAPIAARTGG